MPDYSQLDPSKRDLVEEVNKLGLTEEQEIELALKFSENPEYVSIFGSSRVGKE